MYSGLVPPWVHPAGGSLALSHPTGLLLQDRVGDGALSGVGLEYNLDCVPAACLQLPDSTAMPYSCCVGEYMRWNW
jgi:hypothetical protein